MNETLRYTTLESLAEKAYGLHRSGQTYREIGMVLAAAVGRTNPWNGSTVKKVVQQYRRSNQLPDQSGEGMTRKIRINGPDTVAVGILLNQHVRKLEGGFAVYEDGWDDARVVTTVTTEKPDAAVTVSNVAYLRREMFGNFPGRAGGSHSSTQALEGRVRELEGELGALRKGILSLEQELKLVVGRTAGLETRGANLGTTVATLVKRVTDVEEAVTRPSLSTKLNSNFPGTRASTQERKT